MDQNEYRVTTNFHEIKAWLDAHNAVPGVVVKDGYLYPEIMAQKEEIAEFFTAMLRHDLAFRYKNEWYEFVDQDDYVDEIEGL